MRRLLSSAGVLMIALAAVIAGPVGAACACSCGQSTVAEYTEHADLVFTGAVVDVDEPFLPTSSAADVEVLFVVESVIKGEAGKEVVVRTAMDGASCGFTFREGSRYQVFARDGHTDTCAGNMSLGLIPAGGPQVRSGQELATALIVAAVGATALAGLVMLVLRRRRRAGAEPGRSGQDSA
jgi:hypothetical protein